MIKALQFTSFKTLLVSSVLISSAAIAQQKKQIL